MSGSPQRASSISAPELPRTVAAIGVLAGVFVLAFTILWAFDPIPTHAPLHGDFGGNAILAIEFARSAADVERVIGPSLAAPGDRAIRDRIDALNRHDHVYMAAYGAMLAAGFLLRGRARRRAFTSVGILLVLVGVAFDVLENRMLFALTDSPAQLDSPLASLFVFTHMKWSALALATSLYAALAIREGGRAAKVASAVGLLATPLFVATFFAPQTFAVLLTLSFTPTWVMVFAHCVEGARGPTRRA